MHSFIYLFRTLPAWTATCMNILFCAFTPCCKHAPSFPAVHTATCHRFCGLLQHLLFFPTFLPFVLPYVACACGFRWVSTACCLYYRTWLHARCRAVSPPFSCTHVRSVERALDRVAAHCLPCHTVPHTFASSPRACRFCCHRFRFWFGLRFAPAVRSFGSTYHHHLPFRLPPPDLLISLVDAVLVAHLRVPPLHGYCRYTVPYLRFAWHACVDAFRYRLNLPAAPNLARRTTCTR